MAKDSATKHKTKSVDPSQLKGRRFGRVLTKLGLLSRDQVHEALAVQKVAKKKGDAKKIGSIMIEMGLIEENDILRALAGQAGLEWREFELESIPQQAIDTLPIESATTYQIAPIEYDEASKTLTVALKSPDNFRAVDDLRLLMGFKVNAVVSPVDLIDRVIKEKYAASSTSMADMMADLDDVDLGSFGDDDSSDLSKLASAASDNKIVRLLNLVLLQAIKDKASDIHFEPFEEEFKMRYRIDGVLYEMVPPPMHLAMPIVSRINFSLL